MRAGLRPPSSDEERAAKQGERTFQVTGRRKRGAAAYFEVSLARWKADERSFVTTIWRDVTERRAADLALRESEGRHRALSEALPQLVWTSGADGGCDYFNPQWEDYTGCPTQRHFGIGMAGGVPRNRSRQTRRRVGSFGGERNGV